MKRRLVVRDVTNVEHPETIGQQFPDRLCLNLHEDSGAVTKLELKRNPHYIPDPPMFVNGEKKEIPSVRSMANVRTVFSALRLKFRQTVQILN